MADVALKVGIIGAEQHEIDLLLEKLSGAEESACAGMPFFEGTLSGVPVVVARCGVGKVNAAMCVQVMATRFGVSCVINTGAAGATDDALSVLDMVISTDAVFHDVDVQTFGYAPGQVPGTSSPFFVASSAMADAAERAFSRLDADFFRALEDGAFSFPFAGCGAENAAAARSGEAGADSADAARKTQAGAQKRFPVAVRGRVASGDVFVADDTLRRKIIAGFSPACVEMEGAAVAQACAANKLPFLILRSISDTADEGAGLPYTEFSSRAAVISATVVCGLLESAEDWSRRLA